VERADGDLVTTDSLLARLRAAVQAAPDDMVLREHLARLLVEAGKLEEAAVHAAFPRQTPPRRESHIR
jgi:hypothetical protein